MKKLSREQIKKYIEDHKLWLDSDNSQGEKANFSGKLISIANFKKADLSHVNFNNSILKIIEFVDANLKNANFENAELTKVDFHNANLNGVNFKSSKFKKVHINKEMLSKLKELTKEQKNGIITSYRKFMWKSLF
jgi:uncharacterized protein YjbI with pentapeptide repeats